jgi:DMATS type aromatic prenyltransferase
LVTLRHVGLAKLVGVCRALGYSDERMQRAVEVFERLTPRLAHSDDQSSAHWSSDITDDGTPFEFSVAFHEGRTDLRMLVEPQAPPNDLCSNWGAGLDLNDSLTRAGEAGESAFRQVSELFAPTAESSGHFSLWHAVVIAEDGSALFKVYVNPRIHGVERAPLLVREALQRLGRDDVWQFLAPRLDDPATELRYFSLDLDESREARIKVYVGRSDSAAEIARLTDGASNLRPGDAEDWITHLTGRPGSFDVRPILACFAFNGRGTCPSVTVHVPVRCYLTSDAEAYSRIRKFLSEQDAAVFARILSTMSPCPLRENRGLITYASLRREPSGELRVTMYLAPQAYSPACPHTADRLDWS